MKSREEVLKICDPQGELERLNIKWAVASNPDEFNIGLVENEYYVYESSQWDYKTGLYWTVVGDFRLNKIWLIGGNFDGKEFYGWIDSPIWLPMMKDRIEPDVADTWAALILLDLIRETYLNENYN